MENAYAIPQFVRVNALHPQQQDAIFVMENISIILLTQLQDVMPVILLKYKETPTHSNIQFALEKLAYTSTLHGKMNPLDIQVLEPIRIMYATPPSIKKGQYQLVHT
jgi:hypothetical protein